MHYIIVGDNFTKYNDGGAIPFYFKTKDGARNGEIKQNENKKETQDIQR